ncbi:hypothetical protein C2I33_24590 [Ralstonia solanacearum]|uniref:hypothetical protein n=1 Tax=Ralstonia solanacearum TaxID=305 RepID=UPI0001816DAE|nr:hypothetical protein [Ralstonia solanacearum]MDC6176940.1 hypothetical protein [Ralstonia solanacearum]MDC6212359.1 hypothetical protein [Ralstonia solanacearum]MDC6241673.1 hypothetical protein [Ralstonia solanacearum]MDD7799330.1 hypothetical protein [Ralstonia solanacearum]TYZ49278.1 hypothetical protein C2I33_24590 [Ralstonia solanacearum]
MSTKPETKPSTTPTNAPEAADKPKTKPARNSIAGESPEKFRAALQEMDTERTALAKAAIENIKPGKPFDPAVVRQINKVETRKNRLLVSRFASLLRKGSPEVQAIVHQIIEL